MSATAPTRQVLRHLRRLCTGEPVSTSSAPPPACLRAGHRTEAWAWARAIPAATGKISPSGAVQSRRLLSTTRGVYQEAGSNTTDGHSHGHGHSHNHNHKHSQTRGQSHNQNEGNSSTEHDDAASTTTTSAGATPDITNHYTLFPRSLPLGPPPKGAFDIPTAQLKREFLQLQAQHHPDKHGEHQHSAAHRSARAMSSLLNTAYKTLADPLLRARYLLHHNYGVDITAEDNNTHSGLTDQDTLMEVLEAQEAIEDATTQDQIDALKDENNARIAETVKLLAGAFESEDIDLAKRECIRLNYWRSLQQGLHDWEPGKEVRLIH